MIKTTDATHAEIAEQPEAPPLQAGPKPEQEGPVEPTEVAGPPNAPAPKRRGRSLKWFITGAVALLMVGGLAYAETGWLAGHIPQDSPTRVSLVAFPDPHASGAGLPADWSSHLIAQATATDLAQDVAAKLPAPAAGGNFSAQDLIARTKVSNRCIKIEPLEGQGPSVRGLMLYSVFRGPDPAETNLIAQTWSKSFIDRARGQYPGLIVEPIESLGAPYEMCD